MQLIFVFLMASYGATNILTASKLFRPLRDYLSTLTSYQGIFFSDLVHCPMCIGFWVGVFWYAAIADAAWHSRYDFEWLAFGAMASGFCWIMRVILHKLGEDDL
jgi:hypothetical protein